MIISNFIRQYINEDDVQDIIFHNWIIILRETIRTIVFLGVLYLIYIVLAKYIHRPMLMWIFWWIGIIIFIKYCFDFFNKYIDCLILSKGWITIFSRDWIYKYKTDFFDWDKIETLSHSQNDMRDKLLMKWNLSIHLEHEITFTFENVSNPKKHIKKILSLKENHESKKINEDLDIKPTDDNINMLTEALSEVLKEYLEKKKL